MTAKGSRLFSKILIANRGEVAVRIIRTCRRLGIASVVVYSEADADSLAVEMADETVAIGPSPAAQSYLVAEKIIAACKETGAEAVHPGFGFLSERADFARACAAAGIVFIGPNPHAIDAMGDKLRSRQAMIAAGIPVVPGGTEALQSVEQAIEAAAERRLGAVVQQHLALFLVQRGLEAFALVGTGRRQVEAGLGARMRGGDIGHAAGLSW